MTFEAIFACKAAKLAKCVWVCSASIAAVGPAKGRLGQSCRPALQHSPRSRWPAWSRLRKFSQPLPPVVANQANDCCRYRFTRRWPLRRASKISRRARSFALLPADLKALL